jgi:threonine aldolase
MKTIDLRSDTITQPTPAMRQAMAQAEVGDDVFGEDPNVNQLEQAAAQKLGKEAALFVPSGTMANLISVLTHCQRGDEVILGDQSHIFLNEVGGLSALAGAQARILKNNPDGTLPLDELEKAIRHDEIHYPPTRLIALENTHNYCMGSPLTADYMDRVSQVAQQHCLSIHLDGARIFNAAVALKVDVKRLVDKVDSVMFCLSKGLSAPVGSLLCGTATFILKARKMRKMVGGGMRQAGHLAAAGRIALEELVDRLQEDHQRTQTLARELAAMEAIELDPDLVRTNILFFKLKTDNIKSEEFLQRLTDHHIMILMIDPNVFRIVLHREIDDDQVGTVLKVISDVLQ